MGNRASVDNSQKKTPKTPQFQTSFSAESVFPPILKGVRKGFSTNSELRTDSEFSTNTHNSGFRKEHNFICGAFFVCLF